MGFFVHHIPSGDAKDTERVGWGFARNWGIQYGEFLFIGYKV